MTKDDDPSRSSEPVVDEGFAAQRDGFDFRHACEDCAFFDPPTTLCRHGWPNRVHLRAASTQAGAPLALCKEFELA